MIKSIVLYQYHHFPTKWEMFASLQLVTIINYHAHFYIIIPPYTLAESLTHFL